MAREARPPDLQQAVALYRQQRPHEAERLLAQILQRHPKNVDALHLLGIVAQETGRADRAVALLRKAVALAPRAAPLHDSLAAALTVLGRHNEALAHWDKATEADPQFADAHVNRGTLLNKIGRPEQAVAAYDKALAIDPHFAEAHFNRAVALGRLRQYEEALKSCDRAIVAMPNFPEVHFTRGTILAELKRTDAAIDSFKRTLALQPDRAEAYYNIGTFYLGTGRLQAAVDSLARATELEPDYADAWHNRGIALQDLGQYEEAIVCQEKALALRPDFDFLLGDMLQLRLNICDWAGLEESIERLKQQTARGEKALSPFAALLSVDDPEIQRKAAELYAAARCPADVGVVPFGPTRRSDKIRIGYFSADLREHPVAYLTAGLFEHHDRSRFDIVAFAFGPDTKDAMTDRIARACDEYVDVRGMSDAAVARLAREKAIDIAIDLGGFTRYARPGIFAQRAAPVQASYLGYLGTMGVPYMDYILADPIAIPEVARHGFAEKIVHLPCFQSNTIDLPVSDTSISRAEVGLPDTGFVFCSYNNNFKILPWMFQAWLRILAATPGSVLWIYIASAAAVRNIRAAAAEQGLGADRIVFAERVPRPDYMARLRLADLFLDTAPYNAGTTASDALWMGLPVLTLAGTTFAGRMGASLLTAIGMPEAIAATLDEYEATAIALAHDPDRLAALKTKLAANRSTTRLFDTRQGARDIEAAYAAMIERLWAGLPPDHLVVAVA